MYIEIINKNQEKHNKLKKLDNVVELLPKNSKRILDVLNRKGALTQKDIISELPDINSGAIRYSVRKLTSLKVLVKHANFEDMRQGFFDINPETKEELAKIVRQKNQL